MNNLSTAFFKPNSKCTGSMMQVRTLRNEQTDSAETYFTIVNQVDWDSNRKVGSFKSEDKSNSVNIKLSMLELGSFIYSLNNEESYSTVHKSNEGMTSIKFGPFQRGDSKMFGLSISRNKQKYSCSLTPQEAEVLKIFCQSSIYEALKEEQ